MRSLELSPKIQIWRNANRCCVCVGARSTWTFYSRPRASTCVSGLRATPAREERFFLSRERSAGLETCAGDERPCASIGRSRECFSREPKVTRRERDAFETPSLVRSFPHRGLDTKPPESGSARCGASRKPRNTSASRARRTNGYRYGALGTPGVLSLGRDESR